jgi:non-ribosomal peptide synthetase component E (peptide arylation enzyme)
MKSEAEANKSFLFAKMKEVLPNYCIPDQIEILKQMPVNEHGKYSYCIK